MTTAGDAAPTRRSFLIGGSAVLGGALLLGPGSVTPGNGLTRYAAAGGRRLALGYVAGSEGASIEEAYALVRTAGTRVVPATSIRSAGNRFTEHSAAIRVDGLTPGFADGLRPEVDAAHLDALVLPPRGAGKELLPFYAWTLDRSRAGHVSQATSFTLPVEHKPTVGFVLRVGGAPASGARQWQEAGAVLTAGRDRDLAKLRPGTYLLGFDPDAWTAPRSLPDGDDDAAWERLASVAVTIRTA